MARRLLLIKEKEKLRRKKTVRIRLYGVSERDVGRSFYRVEGEGGSHVGNSLSLQLQGKVKDNFI